MRYLNSDASLENPITLIGRRLQVHFIYHVLSSFRFLRNIFFFFLLEPQLFHLSLRSLIEISFSPFSSST